MLKGFLVLIRRGQSAQRFPGTKDWGAKFCFPQITLISAESIPSSFLHLPSFTI